ncbi:putative histidine kinase [Methanocella paludicola SANAE]|uniref:histidine kinase n=2 Tax=Methanocella TaxID=570266 RepID=D1YYA1_METPS|nr:putative histidine kinase [Methanocella paludicola SANAE]
MPWLHSIRLRTFIIILMMVLPIVLMGVAGTLYFQGVVKQNIYDEYLNNVKTISAFTPDYLQTSQLFLESIADRPSVVSAVAEDNRPVLHSAATYVNSTNRINSIYFVDSKGIVIESTDPISGLIGSNASNYSYVGSVFRTGNTDIGDAVPGLNQMPVVPIGVPIKDNNGTVLGVMVGTVDLEEFSNKIKSTVITNQHAYLVNSTGHIMVHNDPEYMRNMTDFSSVPAVQSVLSGKAGAGEYYNPIYNQSMIGAYAPIDHLGWGVVVAMPQSVAYKPVWDATLLIFLVVVALSLIAAGLGLYLGNSIVAPISSLSHATTEALKIDDYRKSIPLDRKDEIGDLARSFDDMVDTIKRAMEALRESEEKFRVLADTSKAAIYVYQGESLVYVNEAAERITGYSNEELLKMKFWGIVHPDFREMVKERGLARQQGKPAPTPYEIKIITRGGEARWIELSAGPIMYMGKPAGVATFFDVTERKQAEEELNEAKTQAELYLDLMGHDINNMNQSAMGYLELTLNSPDIEKKDKELLLKSMGALESSTRLIDNVRKLQKAQNRALKLYEVDACPAILRALGHYSNMPNVKATFNYELPPGCPVLANDLLHEVFENLIGNAIKHAGLAPTINVKLEATVFNGQNYNKFTVEDDGPGISDDIKKSIFNRLQRGDTKARGSGLGLYLVRSLVDSYGGMVWVEDRVKGDYTQGARFVVMLPAVDK